MGRFWRHMVSLATLICHHYRWQQLLTTASLRLNKRNSLRVRGAVSLVVICLLMTVIVIRRNHNRTSADGTYYAIHLPEVSNRHRGDTGAVRSLVPYGTGDRRPILYFRMMGRLGNKMFQLATATSIAERNDRRLFIQDEDRELPFLFPNISATLAAVSPNIPLFLEDGYASYDDKFFSQLPSDIVQPCCFFQSWKYFDYKRTAVRHMFQPHPGAVKRARSFLDDALRMRHLFNNDITIVGVHVRRGDMKMQQKDGYNTAPLSYIIKAMNYFRELYRNVHFVVCSDDNVWSQAYLQGKKASDVTVSSALPPIVDFALLTLCDHIIMTVGTFGWWAGYMSEGTVIYYAFPVRPNSRISTGFVPSDYFMPHWISMY